MSNVLVWLAVVALGAGALLTLSLFVSAIREKERRAALYSIGMLFLTLTPIVANLVLHRQGFFGTELGFTLPA